MWQNILNSVKTFISAFFKSAWQKELNILMPIALTAVAEVEADPTIVVNSDKRTAAFTKILSQVVSSQKTIAPFLINLALELSVAQIKALAASKGE
jgi:hypothetical protein